MVATFKGVKRGDLVFETVKLTQGGAGLLTIKAGAADTLIRLHELRGTLAAAGTLKISYDDDGAATNEVDFTGAIQSGANGGCPYPLREDPELCFTAPAAKHLTLTSTGGAFTGWAIVSTSSK